MNTEAALIDDITRKQREASRLVQTLGYYNWLTRNGMSWDAIAGVADITERQRMNQAISYHRRMSIKNSYSFKLKDGTVKVIDNVPYDADVIFNRSRL